MQFNSPPSHWIQPISDMIVAAGASGGFFVALHEYRPPLIRDLADNLGFTFFDFREEKLLPLGWEAAQLPLSTLTQEIAERSASIGLVVHNAEAFLATKEAAERQSWLKAFTEHDWPAPVIIPITIFQADLPKIPSRFNRVDPDHVPQESLLLRLVSQ